MDKASSWFGLQRNDTYGASIRTARNLSKHIIEPLNSYPGAAFEMFLLFFRVTNTTLNG